MAAKKWRDMSLGQKISSVSASIIVIVVLVTILSAVFGGSNNNKTTDSQQQKVDQNLTEDQQLKQIVTNVLPGKNSNDQDYIRKVDVTAQPEGGYGIVVEYNAETFKKILIDEEMANVYIALYTSGKNVRSASVSAYRSLIDQYGNESDGVVYKTLLDSDTAGKVNFNADKATLQVSVLPGLWETAVLHQDLR